MNPFIPQPDVSEQCPDSPKPALRPALPRSAWAVFAALCIVFFYSIRWYAGADVRSARADAVDRYHMQVSRTELQNQIMDKVRIPWEKHVSVAQIERLYNGGKPLRHIPPPYNIPQGLTVVVPDTLLGLPARGAEAWLWFLDDHFMSTNIHYPDAMQLKTVSTIPDYDASPQRARAMSITLAKVGFGLCCGLGLAALFLPGQRRLFGQFVRMAAIFTVLAFGFASPLGPEKFVTAMFGALLLAVVYYLKARRLMNLLSNSQQ